jgi:hypothetical protein
VEPVEERPFQDVRGSALICFRVTGNCPMSSSMVMPSSRFSNTRATGVRVPFYLKQRDAPHIRNVAGEGHTPKTWASNLFHFAQRIFR